MSIAGRSTQVLFPGMRYADAPAAIRWLGEAFGFVPQFVVDGPEGTISHAQLELPGGGMMMLGSAGGDGSHIIRTPAELGGVTGSIYAYVADPDAHCARARAAGARIAAEPADTEYGSREYGVYDCEGHHWCFGTYRP